MKGKLVKIATGISSLPSAARVRIPTPIEAALALTKEGPLERLQTGLPTLDESSRGGLAFGRLYVIGGAPDAGKTSFVVGLGLRGATKYPATIHAADVDDREGMLNRIGQANRIDLKRLEARDPSALHELAGELRRYPGLSIIDQDADDMTIDESVELLADRAQGSPSILIVDSLQTVLPRQRYGTEAERVEHVLGVLKRAAHRHRTLVLATSEVPRTAYKKSSGMGVFKHSGAIEYAAAGAFLMRPRPNTDLVVVDVLKLKRGHPVPFLLQFDPKTATHSEADDVRLDVAEAKLRSAIVEALSNRAYSALTHLWKGPAKISGNTKRIKDVAVLMREKNLIVLDATGSRWVPVS